MGLLDDLKVLIGKKIEDGDWVSTEQLLNAFYKTGLDVDRDILYFYALYCFYTKKYAVSMYWIRLNVERFGLTESIDNLLQAMACEGVVDKDEFVQELCDGKVADITAFNRPLKILMYFGLIDIVDYTVEEFKKCYELLGHTVYTLDISDKNEKVLDEFIEIINQGIDFVQVFNNNIFKVKLEDSGKDYLETLGIPCYDYMFDHPMYFQSFYDELPENYIITCVDRNHNLYLNRYYSNKIKNFFLPLGSALGDVVEIPWTERKYTALYVGSLKKNDRLVEDDLSKKITDYLIANTKSTTEAAIETCYKESVNPEATDEEINRAIDKYHYVDMNVNYHFRKKLVEVLVNSGIDVEVYGYGWQGVEFSDNPHFHYGGWISQNECLNMMKNSKFVLNSMPWFKDGIHDRVYNAVLAGAVCITDTSKYMQEYFTDGIDLVLYDLDKMETIPESIRYYEAHPEEAVGVATSGHAKVIADHTWQNRAIELLTHFFNCQGV